MSNCVNINVQDFFLERNYMNNNYIINNIKLDDYQMQLLYSNSDTLVIAGAGAGKTISIVGKVHYLIKVKNVSPKDILIISFTNASTRDISQKIDYDCDVLTFHKLAMAILDKSQTDYQLINSSYLFFIIRETLYTLKPIDQKTVLIFTKQSTSYSKFIKSNYFNVFINFIASTINLIKSNNINSNTIISSRLSTIEKKMVLIILKIYYEYIIEKNAINGLDFDDLITCATPKVEFSNLNYKYIIIDEFQDTSLIRLNLIKKISDFCNSQVIVVGDDWQSIYHFSGCDLNIFLNFNHYFKGATTIKLVNTYRNSQQLINIASSFIEKNPLQVKKNLKSPKSCLQPIILAPYTNKRKMLTSILDKLIPITSSIMILSRNCEDIYDYMDTKMSFENNFVSYKGILIPFYTVHKSKGLEADYTIILNCNNSILGFPNKIEDNRLISKILPNEDYPFAEERRLFYVAITRCKEKTYILYDKNNPSQFIKEIKKIIKKSIHKIEYFKY